MNVFRSISSLVPVLWSNCDTLCLVNALGVLSVFNIGIDSCFISIICMALLSRRRLPPWRRNVYVTMHYYASRLMMVLTPSDDNDDYKSDENDMINLVEMKEHYDCHQYYYSHNCVISTSSSIIFDN